ncbi:hypothetical protein BGZ94_001620, partial [Podila epigama]
MTDPNRQPITTTSRLEERAKIDAQLQEESHGKGTGATVHGIPPFTVPRADGTLEANAGTRDITLDGTSGKMRRRQGDVARGDHDGDGNQTNLQGYRDSHGSRDGRTGEQRKSGGNSGPSGYSTRRPLLQRLRKAFMPILIGGLIAWYYDAVNILVFRTDPRIKG